MTLCLPNAARILAVVLLGATAAAPASATDDPCRTPLYETIDLASEGGIGGTGLGGSEGGIGGTGLSGSEGGIGGTGIFGTVTGFGSVCVNGLRALYDETVEVQEDGEPAGLEALDVGEVVWIEAHSEAGSLVADRIEIHAALVGAVTRIDAAASIAVVETTRVVLPREASERSRGVADVAVGDWLRVSGLVRPDGAIVASRVEATDRRDPVRGPGPQQLLERAGPLARVSVEGFAEERVADDRFRLGGILVEAPGLATNDLRGGERVRVAARVGAAGRLRIERPRLERVRPERPAPARPEAQRPDRSRPDVERPHRDRPDVERPAIERPDVRIRPLRPERLELRRLRPR